MVNDTEGAVDAGAPADAPAPAEGKRRPTIKDKRSSTGGKVDVGEGIYKKNHNRLSNTRWPLGQEPEGPGTTPDDGWVNIKVESHEPDPDPNQRKLLGGGVTLRMPCRHCNEKLHVAANKSAKEVLEGAGYVFPAGFEFPEEGVVACVCSNGHITQLRESVVEMLVARS